MNSMGPQSIVCPVYAPFGNSLASSRSAENPTVPLSQAIFDEDVFDGWAGPKTSSGIRVGRRKALGYSAVWRATNLISRKIAALPLVVFKEAGKGKNPDREHFAHALLRRRPNEYMTPVVFKQTLQSHALLRGNGYAYIFRDTDAVPNELLPLNPEATWPVRENGNLWYVTEFAKDDTGRTELRKLRSEDVLHIRGLGFDGLIGYDVITILRETLAKAIATREHGSRFFSNNAKPSLALEFPAGMRPDAVANVINGWERMNKGLENAHRVGILREGVKLNAFSMNARDSQLTENLAFDAMDIANIFGLPPRKLGMDQGGGYNSLFEENQSVHDDTLDPWCVTWEEECDAKLLTEEQKRAESHCCLFVRNAVMRSNPDQRASFYEKMVQNGLMSRDEARALEDMNPIPNGQGEVFYIKSGMSAIGAEEPQSPEEPGEPATEPAADMTEENPNPTALRSSIRLLLEETTGRMARRLHTHVSRKNDPSEQFEAVASAIEAVIAVARAAGRANAPTGQEIAREMVKMAENKAISSDEFESKCVDLAINSVFSRSENG